MIGLVIGSGKDVYADIEKAKNLFTFDKVFAINQFGIAYPKYDIWSSLHPEHFSSWISERKALGFEIPTLASFSNSQLSGRVVRTKIDIIADKIPIKGSSGLFTTRLALQLGCDKVILAGVPMTADSHFNNNHPWEEHNIFRSAWHDAEDYLYGKVASVSGWTAELLPLSSLR